jgi:hypothetical protein
MPEVDGNGKISRHVYFNLRITSRCEEVRLKSYIVRIYRHEKDNPRKLVGTVEEPHLAGKKAFTDLDELWEILNPAAGGRIAPEARQPESRKRIT